MRAMPYLIKNSAGVWCVQRKVPEGLQAAVARVLGSARQTQAYLKKSLGTKDRREAQRQAPRVIADIERTFREAEALRHPTKPASPLRDTLNAAEIKRMAEYIYAKALAWDERTRFGRDELKRIEAEHVRLEGPLRASWAVPYDAMPEHGMSREQLSDHQQQLTHDLREMRERLALGDIEAVEDHIADALDAFNVQIDRQSTAYPRLGIEVLRAYVRALQAIEQRNAGEPIPTPPTFTGATAASGTLREALEGWKKERERREGTVHEYSRAVELFLQLHGNLPLLDMKRSHARTFREELQLVPRTRKGALLKATLPELSAYGREHPKAPKISPGTINKHLGAVQAIAGWGNRNGLVPDDATWADPFSEMRLEEEQSERAPFDASDLQAIFDAPVFKQAEAPIGAKGAAGIWLPLLALFGGARQAEYAGLRVSDVRKEEGVSLIQFVADRKAGRTLKTKTSERAVPVHPQLVKLGFLAYVAMRSKDGAGAWLFPTVAPDRKGALSGWSKWWGRYLRSHVGVTDPDKVFHSFRHGFQDALRRATPDEELRDALAGRSSGKGSSVSRTYGAKYMLERWGVKALASTINKISYPGLDLSRVRALTTGKVARGQKQSITNRNKQQ